MTDINPFDPERDPALGALLREALAGGDPADLVRRVRASIAASPDRTLDVLSRWLRPRVAAAAAVILLGAGVWWYEAARQAAGTATVADLLVADSLPAQEILLAGLVDQR